MGYRPPDTAYGVTTVPTIQRQGLSNLAFFQHAKTLLQRDYILIVDKSGSMAGSNWREAEKAVAALASHITRCDPDGITIYFFSSSGRYPKYSGVRDPQSVMNAFKSQSPGGSTCLHGVLRVAFDEHFKKGGQTTILVITDGEPDDRKAVEKVIRDAANKIRRDEDLSVSFIQIGHDHSASKFLKHLDDDLKGARFDIVDSETSENMQGMSFADFIAKSIAD